MPFSPQTLDFLFENRLHDSREWFQEHKAEFEQYVYAPLRELVEQLAETMQKIDPMFILEPKIGKTISRIRRDTRFSKDKMLFRSNMWILFIRDKKLYDGLPGYYCDISEQGFSYGCGYYKASGESLESYRELILNHDPAFLKAYDCIASQDRFQLDGDLYKRSKYPEQLPEIQNWMNRKNLGVNCKSNCFDLMFSDHFADEIKDGFLKIQPVYEFLCKVESHKTHQGSKHR